MAETARLATCALTTSHRTQPSSAFPIKPPPTFRVLQLSCMDSKKQSLGVYPFLKGKWMASFRAASITSWNFSWKLVWFPKTLFRSTGAENHSKLHRHTPGTSMSHSRSCRISLSCIARVCSDTHTWLATTRRQSSCYPAALCSFSLPRSCLAVNLPGFCMDPGTTCK